METHRRQTATGAEEDERIRWALAHPGVSDWVKDALRAAGAADPVTVLNDLELLNLLLRARCEARIDAELT